MKDTYKTITQKTLGDYREKGSKFFAYVFPIEDENDFKEQLEIIRKEHPQSRHACYAYRIGYEGERYRANDDGEPSNSAGTPILNALLSAEVTFAASVVIRYFGGTKLGVPGLINAYRTSTLLGLEDNKTVEKTIRKTLHFEFPYDKTGDFMRLANKYDVVFGEQQFGEKCGQAIDIKISQVDSIKDDLTELYGIDLQDENWLT